MKTAFTTRKTPKVIHVLVLLGISFLIIVTQLFLSIWTASGAYEIAALQTELRDYSRTLQTLELENQYLEAPQNLSLKADALGMVASGNPAYLRLSDGTVIGNPQPATADNTIMGELGNLVPIQLDARLMERANRTAPAPTVTPEPSPTVTKPSQPQRLEGNMIPAPITH